MPSQQSNQDSRITRLIELGFDIAWKYEHGQSGEVRYSVMEPERIEYEFNRITEVPITEVPQWAIDQLEA